MSYDRRSPWRNTTPNYHADRWAEEPLRLSHVGRVTWALAILFCGLLTALALLTR